jgi:hypothetical protein
MMRTALAAIAVTIAAASLSAVPSTSPEPAPQAVQRPNAVPSVPVTREGWWIRVNPANLADNVSWRFGAARNKLSNPLRWSKDEQPTEFDVPDAYRSIKDLHLAAIGLPYKAKVSFCVFFADHGAKLVEFDGEETEQVSQDQQEPACVP